MRLFWFVGTRFSSCVPYYRAISDHRDDSSLTGGKKNASTNTSTHRLSVSTVFKMCLCNQTFLLTGLQGWSQQPRGNWTGNNRQSTSWRYKRGGHNCKWYGRVYCNIICLAALHPAPLTETAWGWALAGPPGAITGDEWSWVFGSRF